MNDKITAHEKSYLKLSVENSQLKETIEVLRDALHAIGTGRAADGLNLPTANILQAIANKALPKDEEKK